MSEMQVRLRFATKDDAQMLFQWRNDPVTRAASLCSDEVLWQEHLQWFEAVLVNSDCQLYVAYTQEYAVGTVRADLQSGVYELSWTVAPNWRGQGIAKLMAQQLADQLPGPLSCQVKLENVASQKIAISIGMHLNFQEAGVLHFSRTALE